jgi:L-fuconolactonase
MLIDAHQHFWAIGANGQEWPTPDLPVLYRDYGPADLLDAAAGISLSGTILVQSQPHDADTDWLLRLADETPLVLGVVGWADLMAGGAPDRIAALAHHSKLRGLRPMLQSLPDDDWIADPALDPAIDAMVAGGLTLDALVFTRHLKALEQLAKRRPDLGIVIDHAAKPSIDTPDLFAHWTDAMTSLARFDHVYCKLSGLVTEAVPETPEHAFARYVDHVLTVFGPARIMWGSDWPVVELRTSYRDWLAMAVRLCRLSQHDQHEMTFGTAMRFYRLQEPCQ